MEEDYEPIKAINQGPKRSKNDGYFFLMPKEIILLLLEFVSDDDLAKFLQLNKWFNAWLLDQDKLSSRLQKSRVIRYIKSHPAYKEQYERLPFFYSYGQYPIREWANETHVLLRGKENMRLTFVDNPYDSHKRSEENKDEQEEQKVGTIDFYVGAKMKMLICRPRVVEDDDGVFWEFDIYNQNNDSMRETNQRDFIIAVNESGQLFWRFGYGSKPPEGKRHPIEFWQLELMLQNSKVPGVKMSEHVKSWGAGFMNDYRFTRGVRRGITDSNYCCAPACVCTGPTAFFEFVTKIAVGIGALVVWAAFIGVENVGEHLCSVDDEDDDDLHGFDI